MTNHWEARLAEALTEFEETREQLNRASAEATRISVTVTSKDRSVEATVGAQGELRSLRFPTSRYRSMAPAELSGALMSTIAQARREAAAQLIDLYRPFGPVPGMSADSEAGFTPVSWDDLIAPLKEEGIEVPEPRGGPRTSGALLDELVDDESDGDAVAREGTAR
ncbi:YbaB/EbfC family nucleoid-associated protein [Streptomyces sp. NPDC006798]|uniref:YbaB/EbfC family nucleoid-associated protein n=1 Tax=Streptomyces sp. NPDC006798 TaxID=3155462 RepID=UPI0033D39C9C